MGVGRREFLKICGQALASFAAASTSAIALFDDRYVNRKFGITFRKPPGWRFADVKQMGELAAGQILATDIELTPDIVEWLGLPFVTVHPDDGASDTFTPSAQFYLIEDCPILAELDGLVDQLRQILGEPLLTSSDVADTPPMLTRARGDLEACSELYRSFAVIEPPRTFTLSGCPSATYVAAHLFEHAELPVPVRVRVKTIFTLHNKLAYLVRLIDSPYLDPRSAFSFDTFVAGIGFL